MFDKLKMLFVFCFEAAAAERMPHRGILMSMSDPFTLFLHVISIIAALNITTKVCGAFCSFSDL